MIKLKKKLGLSLSFSNPDYNSPNRCTSILNFFYEINEPIKIKIKIVTSTKFVLKKNDPRQPINLFGQEPRSVRPSKACKFFILITTFGTKFTVATCKKKKNKPLRKRSGPHT